MTFIFTSLVTMAAVQAPVTQVTVFTDQARVVRTAQVTGGGTLQFPPLRDSLDVSSVRVEATGAEVKRVDLERLSPEAFHTAEAKALLSDLDAVDTELARLGREHQALREVLDVLSRLSPTLPQNDGVRPALRLTPQGWAAAMQFTGAQLESAQKRLREVELAQRAATKKREALARKAQPLGNPEFVNGWQVSAELSGSGPATVTLTYLMRQARWTPAWDVQLDPEKSLVTVSLAGLVAQETGEDWDDAELTLSTAIPSAAVKAPQLLTWKIGTTERFIPTPTPVQDLVRPISFAARTPGGRSEETLVKAWLAQAVGRTFAARAEAEEQQARAEALAADRADQSRRAVARKSARLLEAAPPPPPSAPTPSMAPAPGAADGVDFMADTVNAARVEVSAVSTSLFGRSAPQPVTSFSLSPPPGYRPPSFGPDSPVTLAGGYDLSFPSRQRETIPSAKGTRRVALWSQQWPVVVERKVYPALAKEAYLTAELKNPSSTVLPGGPATLSVGADPAGTAQLKLVSPGETVTLPLGLDRAIKAVRNVAVVDATQGVVSQDDVSTYTVTIEVVNPFRTPVALRVFDQWPLPQPNQKDLETKLLDSKPGAIQDTATGRLEWRLTLKPNDKQVLTFSYQLKRPKGWKLYQAEVRP